MRKTIGILVGIGLGLAAGVAHAEGKGMQLPKPAPQMEQLKRMEGTQTCHGKMFASPMGPESAMDGKITIKPDLGGFWYAMRWDGAATKAMPGVSASCFWGFDPGKKVFTEACVDSMGGIAHGTSKGWVGDKWVWDEEGFMGGQKMKTDTTVVLGKGKEVHVSSGFVGPDGKSVPMWETTCK